MVTGGTENTDTGCAARCVFMCVPAYVCACVCKSGEGRRATVFLGRAMKTSWVNPTHPATCQRLAGSHRDYKSWVSF